MSETLAVTVLVHARVQGPSGLRMSVGQLVTLEDSPYVRLLIQSGNVELVDPPSLDPEFLRASGLLPAETEMAPQKASVKDLFAAVPLKKERKTPELDSGTGSKTGVESNTE